MLPNKEHQCPSQPHTDGPRAWLTLCACFISYTFSFGIPNSMGAFFVHLGDVFPIANKHDIAQVVSLPMILLYVSGPISSAVYSSIGVRRTVMFGGCVICTAFCLGAVVRTLWQANLVFAMVGLGCGIVSTPQIAILTEHFVRYRRFALVLMSMGVAVGIMFISPLCEWLVHMYGWHDAMVVMGAVTLHVLPCGLLMVHNNNEYHNKPTSTIDANSGTQQHQRRHRLVTNFIDLTLLRRPLFVFFTMLVCFVYGSVLVYMTMMPALVVERGFSTQFAAFMLVTIGFSSIFGRLGAAVVANVERINGNLMMGMCVLVCSIQYCLLTKSSESWHFTLITAVFGAIQGANNAFLSPTLFELFGARHKFHNVLGMTFFFMGCVILFVPQIIGRVADRSLNAAFWCAAAVSFCVAVSHLALGIRTCCIMRNKETETKLTEKVGVIENEEAVMLNKL